MTGTRELTPERKAALDAAIEDEWPLRQIIATYHIAAGTVKKHYPGYRGMCNAAESGSLSMAIQHTNRKLQAS